MGGSFPHPTRHRHEKTKTHPGAAISHFLIPSQRIKEIDSILARNNVFLKSQYPRYKEILRATYLSKKTGLRSHEQHHLSSWPDSADINLKNRRRWRGKKMTLWMRGEGGGQERREREREGRRRWREMIIILPGWNLMKRTRIMLEILSSEIFLKRWRSLTGTEGYSIQEWVKTNNNRKIDNLIIRLLL